MMHIETKYDIDEGDKNDPLNDGLFSYSRFLKKDLAA